MITEIIGEGAFGMVYLSKVGNKSCVLKKINYEPLLCHDTGSNSSFSLSVEDPECSIMSRTSVRELTFVSHISSNYVTKPIKIDDQYIYMSYHGNNLASVPKLDWPRYIKIFYSALKGLHDIHCANIVHGDIKPQNILIDKDENVRICDFNLASLDNGHLVGNAYTSSYRPLEVIYSSYNYKSDIWALGCTMWELYFGRPLFTNIKRENALTKITETLGPIPEHIYEKYNIPQKEKKESRIFEKVPGVIKSIKKRLPWSCDINYDRGSSSSFSPISTRSPKNKCNLSVTRSPISAHSPNSVCSPNSSYNPRKPSSLYDPRHSQSEQCQRSFGDKVILNENIKTHSVELNLLLSAMLNYDLNYRPDTIELMQSNLFSELNYEIKTTHDNRTNISTNKKIFQDDVIFDTIEAPNNDSGVSGIHSLYSISATPDCEMDLIVNKFGTELRSLYNKNISIKLVNSLFVFMVKCHNFRFEIFYYWVCFCTISLLYVGHECDFYNPPSDLGLSDLNEYDFGLILQDIMQKTNYNLIHAN